MNQNKFASLHSALDRIGITGLTVTNVIGHGMQKGYPQYYRGAPAETRLLPSLRIVEAKTLPLRSHILVSATRRIRGILSKEIKKIKFIIKKFLDKNIINVYNDINII